jgi:hypothetical protein
VRISDAALAAAATLSDAYLPDRQLPDKAIDLIDEAAAKVRNVGRLHIFHCVRTCARVCARHEGGFRNQIGCLTPFCILSSGEDGPCVEA